MNQRGVIFAEVLITLPLLVVLLGSLVTLIIQTAKISREQVADYVLETEAQEVIDRITADARTAHSVKIESASGLNQNLENLIIECHNQRKLPKNAPKILKDNIDTRVYAVYAPAGQTFHIYAKRQNDGVYTTPITGRNSYGETIVRKLKYDENFLKHKILHITLEMESKVTNQKVKFTTAVYMPGCEKINYHGKEFYE